MGRVRFKGIKATPKSLEKDLLARAKRLADDPSVLIPKCEGKCWRCPYDKMLKKMERVQKYRGEEEQLNAFATHGDQLVRAYAATLSLEASGKVPFLTVKKLPTGDVSFAVRGKVDPERLIGVQHFDDPDLRLLAYWEDARSDKLHIYSFKDGLFCASGGPEAPTGYVEEMISEAPYEFKNDSCGHGDCVATLVVKWSSAGKELKVCGDCAGDVNLLHYLASRIAAPDPLDDFEVDVRYSPKCTSANCTCREQGSLSSALVDQYRASTIDDASFLAKGEEEKRAAMRSAGKRVLVLADICYGNDLEKFLSQMKGGDAERMAVSGLLRESSLSVVASSDQAGRIVSDLWSDHKERLMAQVASESVWRPLLNAPGNLTPPQLVTEARRLELAKGVASRLPEFESLGEIGAMADSLARAYKTDGKASMVRALDKMRLKDHRTKALAYAFLHAAGEAEGKTWQFTKEEMDFGTYLSAFASQLMASEKEAYVEALQNILTASGSGETLVKRSR